MTLQPFKSCSGTADSDIWVSKPYELIRTVIGFGIDRVAIIFHGEKVHQIESIGGLKKAMDWCHRRENPIPETDLPIFSDHCEQQR